MRAHTARGDTRGEGGTRDIEEDGSKDGTIELGEDGFEDGEVGWVSWVAV